MTIMRIGVDLAKNVFDVHGVDEHEKPEWYVKNTEPKPEAGSKKGLTLIFDRHSDALSPSTVTDNFQGFLTVIDDNDKFPLTSVTSLIARHGIIAETIRTLSFSCLKSV